MPTLLTMMDISIPSAVEGMDLSRHAMGKGGADHEAAHLQGMGATASWTDGTEWRALRDHEYTYAVYRRDGKELLFHNRQDPYQMIDLAGERSCAALLKHFRQMSEMWRKEMNDEFQACSWYEKHWSKDRNIIMSARGVTQDLDALQRITQKWFFGGVGDRTVQIQPVHAD